MYIPFHMATQEFFSHAKDRLTPDGIIALNVNALTEDSELLQRMTASVRAALPYAYIIPIPNSYNFIVLGSIQPIDITIVTGERIPMGLREIAAVFVKNFHAWSPRDSVEPLTDNKAPVELMTDKSIAQALWESRNVR